MVIDLTDLSSIGQLKAQGDFRSVKSLVAKALGFAIKANSWGGLYGQLCKIRAAIIENHQQLCVLANNDAAIRALGGFDKAKKALSALLGVKLPAENWPQLLSRFQQVMSAFLPNETLNGNSPLYTHEEKVRKFDQIKFQNFVNSSKLEGIDVTKSHLSMAELVKKYTEIGKNVHG